MVEQCSTDWKEALLFNFDAMLIWLSLLSLTTPECQSPISALYISCNPLSVFPHHGAPAMPALLNDRNYIFDQSLLLEQHWMGLSGARRAAAFVISNCSLSPSLTLVIVTLLWISAAFVISSCSRILPPLIAAAQSRVIATLLLSISCNSQGPKPKSLWLDYTVPRVVVLLQS